MISNSMRIDAESHTAGHREVISAGAFFGKDTAFEMFKAEPAERRGSMTEHLRNKLAGASRDDASRLLKYG